jgi:hypothetical protein
MLHGLLVWARKGKELEAEVVRLRSAIAMLESELRDERDWHAATREELSGARYLIDDMRRYIRKLRGRGVWITYSHPVDHIELRAVRPRSRQANRERTSGASPSGGAHGSESRR